MAISEQVSYFWTGLAFGAFFKDFPGVCVNSDKFKGFQELKNPRWNSRVFQDLQHQYEPCFYYSLNIIKSIFYLLLNT